ncbi:transporter protein [Rhizobium phaseoli Ch24-10]|nr:transporter protein [Rhizobium phaseoli Ch24-10]
MGAFPARIGRHVRAQSKLPAGHGHHVRRHVHPADHGRDRQIHGDLRGDVAGPGDFLPILFSDRLHPADPRRAFRVQGVFGQATLDEYSARRAARGCKPAVLRRRQIHAACRRLRHLFRRALHADRHVGCVPRREGRLAAMDGDRSRFRRRDDRHSAQLRDFRPQGAAAGRLRLSVLALPFPQPRNRRGRFAAHHADDGRHWRDGFHGRRPARRQRRRQRGFRHLPARLRSRSRAASRPRLDLRICAYAGGPGFPAGAAVAACAFPIFRDHLGHRARLCVVQRFPEFFQVDRHLHHRCIGPFHHLARAAAAQSLKSP